MAAPTMMRFRTQAGWGAALALVCAVGCSPPPEPPDEVPDATGKPDLGPDASTAPDDGVQGCVALGCPNNLVCNTATGICVDCVTSNECGANGTCDPTSNKCICNAGFHLCNGACLDDTSVDSCGTSCEPCPTTPNGTSSCNAGQCEVTCAPPLILSDGACVGCEGNADCAAPEASVCSDAGTCESCSGAADCAHVEGRPICDGGTCVACTTDNDTACGGTACGPDGTCTGVAKASVQACRPCGADAECFDGHACVPMSFNGAPRTSAYCLPFNTGTCAAPLAIASATRSSVSGTIGSFCTINEALTTCEAVEQYGNPCTSHTDCGAPGLDDGRCDPIDFEGVGCTFNCDSSEECSASLIGCMTGEVGVKWCGAY